MRDERRPSHVVRFHFSRGEGKRSLDPVLCVGVGKVARGDRAVSEDVDR
jgi:hypothetical protein